jgi:DNA-binding response OmpR family regulator
MNKILIIEDEADLRDTIATILTISDFDVCTAHDGKSGIEMVMKENPDLIICDVNMPVMSGFDVLVNLKSKFAENDMPLFLFLTASVQEDDIAKGMKLGANDYIMKPFDVDSLIGAINKNLERSALIKK